MAKIAFLIGHYYSWYNSSFGLAKQLREHGHTIYYLSEAIKYNGYVTAQGYRFIHLLTPRFEEDYTKKDNAPNGSLSSTVNHRIAFDKAYRSLLLFQNPLDKVAEEVNPDIWLVDEELEQYIVYTHKFNRPVIVLRFFICTTGANKKMPYPSSNLLTNTLFFSIQNSILWEWHFLKKRILNALFWLYKGDNRLNIVALSRISTFNFAKEIKHRQWLFNDYKTIQQLVLSLPELDFPYRSPSTNIQFIGITYDEKRIDSNTKNQILFDLIARYKEKNKFIIFCSLGTIHYQRNLSFINNLIQAVKDKEEYGVIISKGIQSSDEHYEKVSQNTFIFNYVSQMTVLKQADIMITHGGLTSIHECILHEVPMIIYPANPRIDHNGNAARVFYYSLGLRGNIKSETSEQIGNKIKEIIINPIYKENIITLNRIQQNYQMKNKGVEIIENAILEYEQVS